QQYGRSTEVPIQERFFAGGARTLRGFGEKMVGPLTAGGIPKGGTLSLVLNFFELRFPIYRILSAATFLEAGNVWGDWHSGTLRHLRWVLGAGLRVHSPLGVLRLDFGLKLDRKPGESIGAVLVDMGQAF
ncbi:MAG: BamA/TamA family outer membrane protein, partial [Calditrichaeota bacterium]|nr:BamA/TamA family outer membrane protein [Calditrichota bacterium]